MLPDNIAIADPQITTVTREIFIQRIGTEHGARGDGIALAERGPALHVDVGFKNTIAADGHVRFDNAIVTHAHTGPDLSAALDFRGPGDFSRTVNCHDSYDTSRASLERRRPFRRDFIPNVKHCKDWIGPATFSPLRAPYG